MPQNAQIQLRRDTAANWTSVNPILALGEMGLETDTRKIKFGDGTTAWTGLSYISSEAALSVTGTGFVHATAGVVDGAAKLVDTADINNGQVTLAKLANMATASVYYRKSAGSGAPEVQSLATLKADLGVTGTNTGDQTITLTGPVTGSGTGSFATTITDKAVTLAKMADVATGTVFYRKTAATGVPEVQPLATLKADLGISSDIAAVISDTAYGAAWDGVTTIAPSKNAVYDQFISVQNALANKAPLVHTHAIADVTGLQAALDAKADDSDLAGYATDAELAAGLATKANTVHTHVIADTTGLQAALDGKAATVHVHTIANVTGLQAALDAKADDSDLANYSLTSHGHGNFTSGVAGFAPASGGGTVNFLRADGTWAAPPAGGGGDYVLKAGDTMTGSLVVGYNTVGLFGLSLGDTLNPGFIGFSNGGSIEGPSDSWGGFSFAAPEAFSFNDGSAEFALIDATGITTGGEVKATGGFYVGSVGSMEPSGADFSILSSGNLELGGDAVNISHSGGWKLKTNSGGVEIVGNATVNDEAYGAGWNGSLQVPTKNALYDKIEALSVGGGGVTTFNTRSGAVTLTGADVSAAGASAGFSVTGSINSLGGSAGLILADADGVGDATLYMSTDTFYVHMNGGDRLALTAAGALSVTSASVADEAYGAGWNGSLQVPTKNALYDKIETLSAGGGLTDGDKGDVVVSGGGTVLTVESAAGSFDAVGNINAGGHIIAPFNKTVRGGVLSAVSGTNPTSGSLNLFSADSSVNIDLTVTTSMGAFYNSTHKHAFAIASTPKLTVDTSLITAAVALAVPDDAYAAGWNGSVNVPTKNAVYDKIEAVVATIPAPVTSIVGITGTLAQFNTALTDDNFAGLAAANSFTAGQTISMASPQFTMNPLSGAATLDLRGTNGTQDGMRLQGFGAGGSVKADTVTFYNRATTLTYGALSSTALAMSVPVTVPDDAYAVGWNGSLQVPTKNAVYDKVELLATDIAGKANTSALANYVPITKTGTNQIQATGASSKIIAEQTGGQFGGTRLTVQSINGCHGAEFESIAPALDLVDFNFKVSTGTGSVRYERRGTAITAPNTFEFQIGTPGTPEVKLGDKTNFFNANLAAIGPNISAAAVDTLLTLRNTKTYSSLHFKSYDIAGANEITDGDLNSYRTFGLIINGNPNLELKAGGTARITIGSAGDITIAGNMTGAAQTIAAAVLRSQNSTGSFGSGAITAGLECRAAVGTDSAYMAFHRPGVTAMHIGLDTDGEFKIGGWSWGYTTAPMRLTSAGVARFGNGIFAMTDRRVFQHASNAFPGGEITMSTGAPSGGADGDIWLQYV